MPRIDPPIINPKEEGEIVVGGPDGFPIRLAVGPDGSHLTVADGAPDWVTPSALPDAYVTVGAEGQILRSTGTEAEWSDEVDAYTKLEVDNTLLDYSLDGHTHAIADVDGLEVALGDRALNSHTHAATEIVDLDVYVAAAIGDTAPEEHTHGPEDIVFPDGGEIDGTDVDIAIVSPDGMNWFSVGNESISFLDGSGGASIGMLTGSNKVRIYGGPLQLDVSPTDDDHATRKDYVDGLIDSTMEYIDTVAGGGGSGGVAGAVQFVLDNDGSVLSTGTALDIEIPFDTTLSRVTVMADQTGSLELDLLVDPFSSFPPTTSIVAATPPTITSGQSYRDLDLIGWTRELNAGDILRVSVTSVTNITRATVSLSAESTIAPPPDGVVYEDLILATSGLEAYWRMDESAEPILSNAGANGFTSAGSGTVTLGQPSLLVGDAADKSIELSTNKYLTTANGAPFNPTGDFTLECWVNMTAVSGVTQTIAGKGENATSSTRQYRLNIPATGEWRASVYSSGGTAHVVGPAAGVSVVTHLALVVSGSNLYLWVNGTMYGPTAISGTRNTGSGTFQVGAFHGTEGAALIADELAFYSVALSEATLQEHYDAGLGV